ncbi:MAG: response regulator [Planctomycetota bacterium]
MADILLTEDDLSLSKVYQKWLEAEGHVVALAEDGLMGFKTALHGGLPDLLITDIMMPGEDGEELTAAFKKIAGGLPVLIVTAVSDESKLNRLRQYPNVRGVLKKPVTREELLGAVDRALEK